MINHYHVIKLRVRGSGILKSRFYALDEQSYADNPNHTMAIVSKVLPQLLANFREERASLEIYVDTLGDYFQINRVEVYVRPIFESRPQ